MDFLKDIKKTSDLLMGKEEKYQEILLSKILEDPFQPRKEFTAADIDDLAESIKLHGVLSPITVRKTKVEGDDNECFALCYGERRYRAAKQAGLISISAIVINGEIEDIKEKQLVENIQRKELSFDEIADTIKYLIDIKKMKKKDIAKSLSKSNSYVSLYYNYAKIDGYIKDLLIEKTKDITLIVEINKFLCNAEAGIKDAALQCIMNEDSINRNIIDRLNNLNEITNDEPVISDEDLARPNIEDYLDEPEDIIINETVQKFQTVEKDENGIAEKKFNEYETEITENIENTEIPTKMPSNKQNEKDNGKVWYKDIFIDNSNRIFDSNGDTLVMLSYHFHDYLSKNNKVLDLLKFVYKLRVQDEK